MRSNDTAILVSATEALRGFEIIIIEDTVFPNGSYFIKADVAAVFEGEKAIARLDATEFECKRGPKPLPWDMTLRRNRRRYK